MFSPKLWYHHLKSLQDLQRAGWMTCLYGSSMSILKERSRGIATQVNGQECYNGSVQLDQDFSCFPSWQHLVPDTHLWNKVHYILRTRIPKTWTSLFKSIKGKNPAKETFSQCGVSLKKISNANNLISWYAMGKLLNSYGAIASNQLENSHLQHFICFHC